MTYLEKVEEYAERSGMPPEEIIAQALDDWFAVVGAARLRPDNVIEFPVNGKPHDVGRAVG